MVVSFINVCIHVFYASVMKMLAVEMDERFEM